MRAAAESNISPIIYVTGYIKDTNPEERHAITKAIQEIFASFTSILKHFLPSFGDLIRGGVFGGMAEKLNLVEIRFLNDPKFGARTYLKQDSFIVEIGTQGLPESWTDQQKQYSRLRNAGMLAHEFPHIYWRFLWGARLTDPKMDIPITKEEGALQEHLCDVIGVACRHLMHKERQEIYSPWSILSFEDAEPEFAAATASPQRPNPQRIIRCFHEALPRISEGFPFHDPHKMSEWKLIQENIRSTWDKGGVHIRCCILNKVFYDFFIYLQPAEGALLTTQEWITPDCYNPLYIWLMSMDCCIRERKLRFKYFATQTISKTFFLDPKNPHRRYLKNLWIKAEVLPPSSKIAKFLKSLVRKKERRDPDEGGGPGEGYATLDEGAAQF